MTEIIMSNSSPLIALHQLERLYLLTLMFGEVHVPVAVQEEVVSVGVLPAFIRVYEAKLSFLPELNPAVLGKGECAAISLSTKLAAKRVLLDDLPARRAAERLGLSVIGTLGILLLAKHRGHVERLMPLLEQLAQANFHIAPELRANVLRKANE